MRLASIIIVLFIYTYQAVGQDGQTREVEFNDGTVMELGNFKTNNYDFPALTMSAGIMAGTRPLGEVDILLPFQVNYMHKKIGFIGFRADIPVLKDFDNQYDFLSSQPGLKTANLLKVHRLLEAGVGFFLLDMDIEHKRKLTVSSRGNTDYVVKLKLPTRYTLGLRSGVFSYRSLMNNYFKSDSLLVGEGGDTLTIGAPVKINSPDLEDVFLTNFSSTSLYLGLDLKKITNTYFEVDDWASEITNLVNVYFDVFFTGKINMENMLVVDSITNGTKSINVLHDNVGGFKYRKTGFRIGLEITGYFTDHSALTFQFEGGVRPGIENVENSDYPLGNRTFFIGRFLYLWGTKFN